MVTIFRYLVFLSAAITKSGQVLWTPHCGKLLVNFVFDFALQGSHSFSDDVSGHTPHTRTCPRYIRIRVHTCMSVVVIPGGAGGCMLEVAVTAPFFQQSGISFATQQIGGGLHAILGKPFSTLWARFQPAAGLMFRLLSSDHPERWIWGS